MKKVITILLAAALMLSMAACGGNSGTPSGNTNTPSGGNNANTSAVTSADTGEPTAMTKDEMLAVAEKLNLGKLSDDIDANRARAIKTYEGNIYTISGIVTEIDELYYTIVAPMTIEGRTITTEYGENVFALNVYPREDNLDELLLLNKDEMITIVGPIYNLEDTFADVFNGCYVDNMTEITGTVKFIRNGVNESIYNGSCHLTTADGKIYKLFDYVETMEQELSLERIPTDNPQVTESVIVGWVMYSNEKYTAGDNITIKARIVASVNTLTYPKAVISLEDVEFVKTN